MFIPWIPLAAMWILMAVEQPGITAVITRLAGPKIQLAAFGFTFALALFIEGPVIQLLAAGTALPTDRERYRKLIRFMHIIALGATSIHFILALPPVYVPLLRYVIKVPEAIIQPSQQSFMAMLPWTAAVGYRRLWQGVLIRYGRSYLIPITMIIRLLATGGFLLIGFSLHTIPGALLGGLSLSAGVIAGAVASWWFVRPVVRHQIPPLSKDATPFTWKMFLHFYVPLALTSFIALGARPLLNFILAQGPKAVESLAVWPVLISFLFLFHSISISLQEIVISQLKGPKSFISLKGFSKQIALALGVTLILVTVTPLRDLWFIKVTKLPAELLPFVPFPLLLLLIYPSLAALVSLYRGSLVYKNQTMTITKGVIINSVVMLTVAFLGMRLLPAAGVFSATLAFTTALAAETLYLLFRTRNLFSEQGRRSK